MTLVKDTPYEESYFDPSFELGSRSLDDILTELGFTPTGKRLGEGAWGVVDEYIDRNKQRWAIKKIRTNGTSKPQAEHRKLDLNGILEKETIPLSAASHFIVPRIVGDGFVAMPVYSQLQYSLEDGKPTEPRRVLAISKNIVHALGYLHRNLGRAYADLKPANVLLDDEGNAMLTDLGTSTLLGKEQTDPRDNIGEICSRAPECFAEGSHPDERSDVYALGAFVGKLASGFFPHEKRLTNAKDPVKEIQSMIALEANARTAEYADQMPKALYNFIRKCLYHNPRDRYSNAKEAEKALEKAIIKYERSRPIPRLIRAWIFGGLALALGVSAETYFSSLRENQQLEHRIEQKDQERDFEHRLKIISLYVQKRDSNKNVNHQSSTRSDWVEEGKLLGYLERFSDQRTAFAAYLNPIAVCKAIDESKSERYLDIEDILYKIDSKTAAEIENGLRMRVLPSGGAAMGMEDRRNENKRKAVEEFNEMQRDYKRYQELEAWEDAAYRKCKDELGNTGPKGLDASCILSTESYYFRNYVKSRGESGKYEDLQRLRQKFRTRSSGGLK